MKKYLIEVEHDSDKKACEEAIKVFLNTGSHFMTHADWGCMDGEHKAWITMETDRREDALSILPPAYRRKARVIELTRFKLEEPDGITPLHG